MFEDGIDDKAVWDLMGNKMTTTIDPSHPETQDWIKHYLRYYTSGNKVFVQDYDNTGIPEAVFARPSYEQLGITKQDLVTWLERQGIKKMKRPKPYKSTPPIYD